MLFDNSSLREGANDQAEGLRQLRRSDSVSQASGRALAWPRVVLLNEFPGTEVGARFAFHLTRALGENRPAQSCQRNLLVDLAPAAGRLPHALSDLIPADRYLPLWSELAAGRSLSTLDVALHAATSNAVGCSGARSLSSVAVAADPQMAPPAVEQLPRLYEQFVRQLSRHGRWGWIVLLALDHIVPLDRACWQAADDVILIGGGEPSSYQRQAAALRSRLPDGDVERRLWALPQRRGIWSSDWRSGWPTDWWARGDEAALAQQWFEAGIAPQLLPAVRWPQASRGARSRQWLRADRQLQQSAAAVACALRSAAGCEIGDRDGREDVNDWARLSGFGKKIQLRAQLRPITQLSEAFRA